MRFNAAIWSWLKLLHNRATTRKPKAVVTFRLDAI
jgi:hypothetical protein